MKLGKRWLVLCLIIAFPAVGAPAEKQKKTRHHGPKLVVLLVVDQMRADYIAWYQQQWTRGLRRLVDHGAWFQNAAYPYLNTVTCAGHATISSGAFPSTHGQILNGWWDRNSGRTKNCTEDHSATLVSYGGPPLNGGAGPDNLKVPVFADEMQDQLGRRNTRVVSLSLKARSAIMMAGRHADVATWFDSNRGVWLTSRTYSLAGVPFIRSYVQGHPVDSAYGREWKRALPESAYLNQDNAPDEQPPAPGWAASFPHVLRGRSDKPDASFYSAWSMTPFSDAYLGELAKLAVDKMKLGRGRGTDMLAVSFSALDYAGHEFGPRSHEVQDVLIRVDKTIGDLLDHLDKTVGAGKYVVALSADHGVAQVPEQLIAKGEDAGRIRTQDVVKAVEKALGPYVGNGNHMARAMFTDLYFTPGVHEKLEANPEAMKAVLDAIQGVPGVGRVFHGDQLVDKKNSDDPVERAAALSYFPGRSGDLIVVPKEKWFFVSATGNDRGGAATHGTFHPYDSRVPVILLGWGIRPAKYHESATPADIAPTLGVLCGVKLRHADGRVLTEALATPAKP